MSAGQYAVFRVSQDGAAETRQFHGLADTFEAVCRRVLDILKSNDRAEVYRRIDVEAPDRPVNRDDLFTRDDIVRVLLSECEYWKNADDEAALPAIGGLGAASNLVAFFAVNSPAPWHPKDVVAVQPGKQGKADSPCDGLTNSQAII